MRERMVGLEKVGIPVVNSRGFIGIEGLICDYCWVQRLRNMPPVQRLQRLAVCKLSIPRWQALGQGMREELVGTN